MMGRSCGKVCIHVLVFDFGRCPIGVCSAPACGGWLPGVRCMPTAAPRCESNTLVRATVGVVSVTFGAMSYFALCKSPPSRERIGRAQRKLGMGKRTSKGR